MVPPPWFSGSAAARTGGPPPIRTAGRVAALLLLALSSAATGQAVYSDDRAPNVFPPTYEFGSYGSGDDQLNGPSAVAAGPGDRIYVADTRNHRIQIRSLQGNPIGGWGRMGSGPSEFLFPEGVAAGPDGEVFVADTGNHRIQVFTPNGEFLREWGRRGTGPGGFNRPAALSVRSTLIAVAERGGHRIQLFSTVGEHRRTIGGFGDAPGQFKEPLGVALDDDDSLFVADSGNHRIQKFDAAGRPVAQWGRWGPHPGFFSSPSGLACFGGRLYVADAGNHRIQVLDPEGGFLSQWGRHPTRAGEGRGRLHFPSGIAVNRAGGFTLVCEPFEHRLQVFANGSARAAKRAIDLPWWDDLHQKMHGMPAGNAPPYTGPSMWQVNPPVLAPILEQDAHALLCFDLSRRPPSFITRSGGYGVKLGEYNGPAHAALEPEAARIWVSDRGNRRVQVVEVPKDDRSSTGYAPFPKTVRSFEPGVVVPRTDGGFDPDSFSVDAVALRPGGSVYLADGTGGLVLVFDPKLQFVKAIRPDPPPSGRPPELTDAVFGPDGTRLFLLDRANFRILVLDPDGRPQGAWGRYGAGEGDAFRCPSGIAVDREGSAYVTDAALNVVKKFDPRGRFLKQWGGFGRERGKFSSPGAVRFVAPSFIVVDDVGNHRGQTFTTDGEPIEIFFKGGSSGPAPVK